MKAIKVIGQILASLVYTPLYTGIIYTVTVLSTTWIITLSFWSMILAFFVEGGIIVGFISLLQAIGFIPFVWIVKKNPISLAISVGLCVIFPVANIVSLWRTLLGQGVWGIIMAVVLSLMLLQFIFASVGGVLTAYRENNN